MDSTEKTDRSPLVHFNGQRDATDLDHLSNDMLHVVQETLQLEHVSLWLKKAEVGRGKAER